MADEDERRAENVAYLLVMVDVGDERFLSSGPYVCVVGEGVDVNLLASTLRLR